MSISKLIKELITYARFHLHLEELDEMYKRNELLAKFKCNVFIDEEIDKEKIKAMDVPDELVEEIKEVIKENNICPLEEEEIFITEIFGLLSPLPSVINYKFNEIAKENKTKACNYLYDLSIKNWYIKKSAISKNIKWNYIDEDNQNSLEITINLSKPEKSNKDIQKLLTLKKDASKYPQCLLCYENEGYKGTLTHPARKNIRTIDLTLNGENWFMQYSPYAYYNEHCIVINKEHKPMNIDETTPRKLVDFIDYLPNYFIGSNASLPIVGGSILNHEHFQGGNYTLPMFNSSYKEIYYSKEFPSLKIGILNWYNSTIKFEGTNKEELFGFAKRIIDTWRDFNYEECSILSHSGSTPHNVITPVLRKENGKYAFYFILRNNRTNEEYPDGIFHVHKEYFNIKSEGIGLIEAMGLFILPPRLKKEFALIEDILLTNKYDEEINNDNHPLYKHRVMVKDLLDIKKYSNRDEANEQIKLYTSKVCKNILVNTAVFKQDEVGQKGFKVFLSSLGLKKAN